MCCRASSASWRLPSMWRQKARSAAVVAVVDRLEGRLVTGAAPWRPVGRPGRRGPVAGGAGREAGGGRRRPPCQQYPPPEGCCGAKNPDLWPGMAPSTRRLCAVSPRRGSWGQPAEGSWLIPCALGVCAPGGRIRAPRSKPWCMCDTEGLSKTPRAQPLQPGEKARVRDLLPMTAAGGTIRAYPLPRRGTPGGPRTRGAALPPRPVASLRSVVAEAAGCPARMNAPARPRLARRAPSWKDQEAE